MGEIGGILSKFKEIKEKNIKKLEFSREFFYKDVKKLLLDLQNENVKKK